jgi:aldehyde:ferredoxin oxidoreductase
MAHDYTKRTNLAVDVEKQKAAHKVLAEFSFKPSLPERGYTDRTLYVDLDTLTVSEKPVPREMRELFIGGRGYGLKYLWDAVKPTTRWNDPENELRSFAPAALCALTPVTRAAARAWWSRSRRSRRAIDCNVGATSPAAEGLGIRRPGDPRQGKQETVVFVDGVTGR